MYLKILRLWPNSEGVEGVAAMAMVGPFSSETDRNSFCDTLAAIIELTEMKNPHLIKFVEWELDELDLEKEWSPIPPADFPSFLTQGLGLKLPPHLISRLPSLN